MPVGFTDGNHAPLGFLLPIPDLIKSSCKHTSGGFLPRAVLKQDSFWSKHLGMSQSQV